MEEKDLFGMKGIKGEGLFRKEVGRGYGREVV